MRDFGPLSNSRFAFFGKWEYHIILYIKSMYARRDIVKFAVFLKEVNTELV